MQEGHNFIFLKIYIHGDISYSDHIKKTILLNIIFGYKYIY